MIPDANADSFLLYSAWAHKFGLDSADCTGVGPARKSEVGTEHVSFRCRVTRSGKPAGSVIGTALGPEWLRVTRVVSGTLKPDPGIGKVPAARPLLDSDDANTALERSKWAQANDVEGAYCLGVGPYKEAPLGNRFGAFSCATIDVFGQRSGTVLVQTVSSSSVRVIRKLS